MSVKTFIVDRIIQSTAVRMTPAMPSATESRKLIFITDHGSTRATARRTRRGPLALRGAVAVRAPAVFVDAAGWPGPTRWVGAVRLVTAPRESGVPGSVLDAPEVLPAPVEGDVRGPVEGAVDGPDDVELPLLAGLDPNPGAPSDPSELVALIRHLRCRPQASRPRLSRSRPTVRHRRREP